MSTIQKPDFSEYAKTIAKEIEEVVPNAKATVINASTIQIDNDGIISSVRVREVQRKGSYADVKVTHGGKSKYEDNGKVVGEAFASEGKITANIKEKAIKAIASESTSWDITNISEAISDNFNDWREDNHAKDHPSIEYSYPYDANGKVGISVRVNVPNAEDWESVKKSNKTKFTIPSGKVVMKIISESDIDFKIDDDTVYIQGTVERVQKVIDRITGNPFTDW